MAENLGFTGKKSVTPMEAGKNLPTSGNDSAMSAAAEIRLLEP
jgi:hypothetical protein